MKHIIQIFSTIACLLLLSATKADEAFLQQAVASFPSQPEVSSPLAIAVPVVIGKSITELPETNSFKQNILQVTQNGVGNSVIGIQTGARNLSIISQQGSENKVVISQRAR